MGDLMTINGVETMDSREIAEITGKDHAHVCRDIQAMLQGLGINQSIFGSVYKAGNGEDRRCYKLPYRETMILVSGYSVELRSKVIDRWLELERASAPAIPKTFAEALQLAADQAKEIEAKTAALAIAAPKAELADRLTASNDAIDIGTVSRVLSLPYGRNTLFSILRGKKILMADNRPYQEYMDRGYFRVIEEAFEVNGKTKVNFKTLVYQKGIAYLSKILTEE